MTVHKLLDVLGLPVQTASHITATNTLVISCHCSTGHILPSILTHPYATDKHMSRSHFQPKLYYLYIFQRSHSPSEARGSVSKAWDDGNGFRAASPTGGNASDCSTEAFHSGKMLGVIDYLQLFACFCVRLPVVIQHDWLSTIVTCHTHSCSLCILFNDLLHHIAPIEMH